MHKVKFIIIMRVLIQLTPTKISVLHTPPSFSSVKYIRAVACSYPTCAAYVDGAKRSSTVVSKRTYKNCREKAALPAKFLKYLRTSRRYLAFFRAIL